MPQGGRRTRVHKAEDEREFNDLLDDDLLDEELLDHKDQSVAKTEVKMAPMALLQMSQVLARVVSNWISSVTIVDQCSKNLGDGKPDPQ